MKEQGLLFSAENRPCNYYVLKAISVVGFVLKSNNLVRPPVPLLPLLPPYLVLLLELLLRPPLGLSAGAVPQHVVLLGRPVVVISKFL